MQEFTLRTVEIILNVPPGKIMTYGQIAALAGSPRGARQVVRILHSLGDKYNLPWHRVVNAQGRISLGENEGYHIQRALLESEGVVFDEEGTLDLAEYRFIP